MMSPAPSPISVAGSASLSWSTQSTSVNSRTCSHREGVRSSSAAWVHPPMR